MTHKGFHLVLILLGGNLEPMILVRSNTQKGYEVAELGDSINLEYPNSTTRRGRVGKQTAQTITTAPHQGVCDVKGETRVLKEGNGKENTSTMIERKEPQIRKLTPKECFRLMGFDDADVEVLIANGISNTQLYKMAGNSIVVNVLEFIFCQIFDSNNEIWV